MRVITSASQQVLPGYTKEGQPRFILGKDGSMRPAEIPGRSPLPSEGEVVEVGEIENTTDVSVNSIDIEGLGQGVDLVGGRGYFPARHLVRVGEVYRRLSENENTILGALLEQPGRIMSQNALIYRVWAESDKGTPSLLSAHVSLLRRKLRRNMNDSKEVSIVTSVYHRGYKLETEEPKVPTSTEREG